MVKSTAARETESRTGHVTPLLDMHLAQGSIVVLGGLYMGRAHDGALVDIGETGDPLSAEDWLVARPVSSMW